MSGKGFDEVYHLEGGIRAWNGWKALGPKELNLDLIRGDEKPREMIALAYSLEEALFLFYRTLQAEGEGKDPGLMELFSRLAGFEERHKAMLLSQYARWVSSDAEVEKLKAVVSPRTLEGGFAFSEFLKQNESALQTPDGVLDLAMMLETQALDLYLRLAEKSQDPGSKEVFWLIGQEEKGHLTALGVLRGKSDR